ncbi:unnamed protein product [Acidocella sp. C78]|uniref:LacI family DNA-binding transcriptional regulator n=1 Tax=Acidocella sp. C78 TaxID=1671486 RepID=UPI00191BAA4D|nr:LacI family DNA-binding transcriptional regulator [Acidocella sp. C78]CAG4910234.1 unnamed protein product [Acidocella sp. C78]
MTSPLDRAPTMDDVAAAAGVSKMTVSRALRGAVVAAPTRARIMEAVSRLGYVPHAAAGALASRRSGFVAAIVPSMDNSNFAETVAGLEAALRQAGLDLLLGTTLYSSAREEALLHTLMRHRPEGIVLTGGAHSRRVAALLGRSALPVVETWDLPASPIGGVVGFSNRAAGAAMTAHLASIGRRRIAFLGGASRRDPRGEERGRGYEEALASAGLGPPRLFRHGQPPLSMRHGAEGMARLLERWPEIDAVVCASDLIAFGAIGECQRRGIAVPARIAIGGFGDFEVSRCAVPAISTVAVDARGIGERAGAMLARAVAARRRGDALPPERIEVGLRLVARGSSLLSGPPPDPAV